MDGFIDVWIYLLTFELIYLCMEGTIDELMDFWMDENIDVGIDLLMYGCIYDVWIDLLMYVWINPRKDGFIDVQTNLLLDKFI